ncbi:hypothetical protein KBB08_02890 [Candidatus Gracilibacteria bacterium]|nr:hypothetical protein [Candidatus Gracilibacteria bacterium]
MNQVGSKDDSAGLLSGNHQYIGNPEYRAVLDSMQSTGVCVFCAGELARSDSRIKLTKQVAGWGVFPNTWPYKGNDGDTVLRHWVLTGPQHVAGLEGLAGRDFIALLRDVMRWVLVSGRAPHGIFGMRYGSDTALSGVTLAHLHAHAIMPKPGTQRDLALQHWPVEFVIKKGEWTIGSVRESWRVKGKDGRPAAKHWLLRAPSHVTDFLKLDPYSAATFVNEVVPWVINDGGAASGGLVIPYTSRLKSGRSRPLLAHVVVPHLDPGAPGKALHVNFPHAIRGGQTVYFPVG